MLNEFKQQETLKELIEKSRKANNLSSVVNKALNEIKKELISSDRNVKINAIQKLIFLELNNFDIKWASFHTMEILATCGPQGKRFGYTIGQLQYKNNKEFLQLIPNLIKKDLKSQNLNFINYSLNFVNNVMDVTIANELCFDLEKLFNLNNHLIRKKLIISLAAACEKFLKHSTSMNTYWDNLIIKYIAILNNTKELSNGVAICIISSIQRICKNYPERCITVFVELMNYFTRCEINWNFIKIIDIFGIFFSYEPKFTRKKEFIKILSEQLAKTKSKSVEVQLVKLILTHFEYKTNPTATELFQNCEERLKNLLLINDCNLVVISLRICKDLIKKKKLAVSNYLDDIKKILDSNSNSNGNFHIQKECLEIINLCVSNDNYKQIVDYLFGLKETLGTNVILTILDICNFDTYSRLQSKENFLWYLEILFSMAESQFTKKSELKVAYTIRDIAQRIESLRELVSEKSFKLICDLIDRIKESSEDSYENSKIKISIIDSESFDEQIKFKNSDSLITVLSFIIGEYTLDANTISTRTDFLLNSLTDVNDFKESYYIPIMYCLLKFSIKLFNIFGKLNEDFVVRLENLANTDQDVLDLEFVEMNMMAKNILEALKIQSNPSCLKSLFQIQILPTHEKAQLMVKPGKEIDLNICFPLNDDELKTHITKKTESESKRNENTLTNPYNINESNFNDNKLVVDKKIYTPDI